MTFFNYFTCQYFVPDKRLYFNLDCARKFKIEFNS